MASLSFFRKDEILASKALQQQPQQRTVALGQRYLPIAAALALPNVDPVSVEVDVSPTDANDLTDILMHTRTLVNQRDGNLFTLDTWNRHLDSIQCPF